jgi:hypothetical protein
MKRRLKAALMIVAAMTILLSACTIVIRPTGVEWSLYYTWQGWPERYAVWTLYSDGTFVDNYDGTGYWSPRATSFSCPTAAATHPTFTPAPSTQGTCTLLPI